MATATRHNPRKGRYVRFLVRDIQLPCPNTVLNELHGNDELKGKVLDVSSSADVEGSGFVAVKVRHVSQLCIVPVDRLRG
jgi:hypothetical protein